MSVKLRLLLADDHALFREGLASLLNYQADMEVVGQASNGQEAIDKYQQCQPDVVLMDIDMPLLDGLGATRVLVNAKPEIKIVILTVHEEEEKLFEAIKSGAQGYILKNVRTAEMLEMLRGLAAGEAAISRSMATRLLREFARQNSDTEKTATPKALEVNELQQLSFREREILELVAQHATNKEIAVRLCISEYTVKNHLRNILSKLHLRNRAQAAQMLANSKISAYHS